MRISWLRFAYIDSSNEVRRGKISGGKERIVHLLQEAGATDVDHATRQLLPSWDHIARFIGQGPQIVGLNLCQAFQDKTMPLDRFLCVAGIFNSGTNLLHKLLFLNFKVPTLKKVPWG